MCVIIYVPQSANISKEEVLDAWRVNPDGAGFSVQRNGKVFFQRGFMNVESYWNAIEKYIGQTNLLLHFRISTSNAVNKVQTHPYKKGNVTVTRGFTDKPVICMNGVIYGQEEYKDCNDTMSYIIDHQDAFANVNQDILNIIEEATGAKWAVMKPDEVLVSSEFEQKDGKWYSNMSHLYYSYIYSFNKKGGKKTNKRKKTFNNIIKTEKLRNGIKKDKILYEDLTDFIEIYCNGNAYCNYCSKCLESAKTLRDVKIILNENYYYGDDYTYYSEEYDNCNCNELGFIDYDMW